MEHKVKIFIAIIIIVSSACCSDDNSEEPSLWRKIESFTDNNLADIEFINDDFGIICGGWGTVLKTENGGEDWIPINLSTNHSFVKVFLLSENEFFVSRNGLYKTNNGGDYFTEIGDLSSFGSTIFEVIFFDSDNGLIYKSGRVYKTNDGGVSWNEVYEGGFCDIMQFNSNNIGYIAGGASWDGMSYGELHKTIDGGNTWTDIGNIEEIYGSEIMSMDFIDDNIGYISNLNKEFYITQNGGASWLLLSDNLPGVFKEILFLTKEEGYGLSSFSIFKTIDGGVSWGEEYTDSSMVFSSITATPDGTLFVIGNDGVILRK